jgi:ribosomal protein S18 acetylase RimI-like enzyme
MDDLRVRDAVPGDVQSITRVAEAGWTSAYRDLLAERTIEAALDEWYDTALTRERIEDDAVTYLVAEQADTVVGYASGAAVDGSVVVLASIYVMPDRWGEGIGTALLDTFETRWSGRRYDAVRLDVLADNEVGQRFYRARGYEAVEEQETELFGETVRERRYRKELEPGSR